MRTKKEKERGRNIVSHPAHTLRTRQNRVSGKTTCTDLTGVQRQTEIGEEGIFFVGKEESLGWKLESRDAGGREN